MENFIICPKFYVDMKVNFCRLTIYLTKIMIITKKKKKKSYFYFLTLIVWTLDHATRFD